MAEVAARVIILDRAVEDEKPPYCIHGSTLCVRCRKKVWLGTETLEAVKGGARPLCLHCANELAADGTLPLDTPRDQLHDHLRADGPHE